jgi:hypothetical protein
MTAAAISETIKVRMFHYSFGGGYELFANSPIGWPVVKAN